MRSIRIARAERPISPRAYPRAGRQGAKAGTRERVPTVLGELSRRVARWALAPRRAKAGPSQTARPVHTHAQGLVVSIGRRGVHVSGSSRAESLLRLISFSRVGMPIGSGLARGSATGVQTPVIRTPKRDSCRKKLSKRRRRSKPKSRQERSFGEETPGRPSAL